MSKVLALSGLTGKSGEILSELLAENIETVNEMFPDGIRIFVRATSTTEN